MPPAFVRAGSPAKACSAALNRVARLVPQFPLADLRAGDTPPRLLDVRTREEFDAVNIDGSILMDQEKMQEILGHWDKEELFAIVDHQGKQGLDAASFFLGHGFKNVRCLRGGIDAWSAHVDPSVPRY